MEPEERTYAGADGTDLPMWVWRKEADGPQPALVYLHGIQSHSGWYEASSRTLAEAGAAVYQIERRGSGRDGAHPRGHVDRAETWLEDVAAAAEVARGETGAGAVHLMGVSWGGKLALACAGHRPDLYRSLILSAPGIFPKVDVALLSKVRVGRCLMMGREEERFPIPLEDPHLFTETPDRVRYIAEDPLSLRDLTARFMFESRRLDGLAREAAGRVRVPALLCLAGRDRITDNEATRRLVYGIAARKRVRVYEEAHHTLEFEPDPTGYFADLLAWITAFEPQRAQRTQRNGEAEE
jgi:alpha-beta hydrolase superfamily lysophospholipase